MQTDVTQLGLARSIRWACPPELRGPFSETPKLHSLPFLARNRRYEFPKIWAEDPLLSHQVTDVLCIFIYRKSKVSKALLGFPAAYVLLKQSTQMPRASTARRQLPWNCRGKRAWSKELEIALPMCICDVAEQTGHWKGITSSLSALLRHPGHPRPRHNLNLNHELRKTIAKKSRIIKRPLTGSNQLVFLVLFLVSFRLQNNFAVHL